MRTAPRLNIWCSTQSNLWWEKNKYFIKIVFCLVFFYRKNQWKVMTADQNPASKYAKWASLVRKLFLHIFVTATFHWDLHKLTLVMTILQKVNFFVFTLQFGLHHLVQHCIKGAPMSIQRVWGSLSITTNQWALTPREQSDPDGSASWDVFLCSVK